MPKYQWGSEIHRILNETAIVRHDIFGQSNELGMSVNRPWIAIEVINTHFPEEEAFAAMLETTKRIPLLILFDFTSHKNRFLNVDKATNRLVYRPWTYLIRNGQLWRGTSPTEITSSSLFKVSVEAMFKRWAEKKKGIRAE